MDIIVSFVMTVKHTIIMRNSSKALFENMPIMVAIYALSVEKNSAQNFVRRKKK